MRPNPQFPADLVTITKEILNGKLHFLCSVITLEGCLISVSFLTHNNPLSANPTKWPNALKQFVGKLPRNCLSEFDHFMKLALKWLRDIYSGSVLYRVCKTIL